MGVRLPDDVRAVIDGPNFAHLTTLDADGWPHTSAMWIMRDGDLIVFNTAEGRRKWHNMRRDPRVAISISPSNEMYENHAIQGRVTEMRTSDGVATIDALAKKYLGLNSYPWLRPGMVRVTVVVEPTRLAGN